MKKQLKIPELIGMISSVLERSRGALSEDEVQAFEKTRAVLIRLEEAEPSEAKHYAELIALNLLKLFAKPAIMEHLLEWFNN